jgi:polar amino acid transport system substrate-binding protein
MQRRNLLKLLGLTCLPITSAQGQEITPMQISTLLETDPATTIAERVLHEAYRRLGLSIVVNKLPGERSLFAANHGQMDGELYRKLGMERDYPNLQIIPVPLLTYEIVIFTLGTSFVVNGWESLRPFTIGFVKGIKIIEQNTQGMKLEPTATMHQAFLKMSLGALRYCGGQSELRAGNTQRNENGRSESAGATACHFPRISLFTQKT